MWVSYFIGVASCLFLLLLLLLLQSRIVLVLALFHFFIDVLYRIRVKILHCCMHVHDISLCVLLCFTLIVF